MNLSLPQSAVEFPRSILRQPSPILVAREWLSTRNREAWPEAPDGQGRPLLLIPGFLAGDASLDRLNAWLRQGDFRTYRSGTSVNIDCMEPMINRMSEILKRTTDQADAPATIIGQSRGGILGRALAAREPGLVETLVTLGSPTVDQLAIKKRAELGVRAVSTLGSLGVPGLFSRKCRDGDCCSRSRADLVGVLSPDLNFVSMYSQRDEVVDWEACLDPAATHVEIPSTHMGMAMDAQVWRELSAVL